MLGEQMKNKNLVILVSVIVGAFAVLFGAWHLCRQKAAADQAKTFFSAPSASGLPDLSHDAPPPPQP
jgi:hypothetical protein